MRRWLHMPTRKLQPPSQWASPEPAHSLQRRTAVFHHHPTASSFTAMRIMMPCTTHQANKSRKKLKDHLGLPLLSTEWLTGAGCQRAFSWVTKLQLAGEQHGTANVTKFLAQPVTDPSWVTPLLKPYGGTNCIEKRTRSSSQPACHLFFQTHILDSWLLVHTLRPTSSPPLPFLSGLLPVSGPWCLKQLWPQISPLPPSAHSRSPHSVSPTASKRPFLPTPSKGFFRLHRSMGNAVLVYSLASPTAMQAREGRDFV